MKKIIASFGMASPAGRKQLAGLYRFVAGGHDWDITLFRHGDLWHVDTLRRQIADGCRGIITSSLTRNAALVETLADARIPVVIIDVHTDGTDVPNLNLGRIFSDDYRAGVLGAQHLLSLGHMRTYGFIPFENPTRPWSRLRAEGAADTLTARGQSLAVYDARTSPLADWLAALPKPAAVIAASDDSAAMAASLCRTLKIAIPEQLLLLGNDDDELVCDNTRPRLTSVRIPHEEQGFRAGQMLERMMRRPGQPVKDVVIAPLGITVRESTKPISPAAGIIERALAYIRENAASDISIDDVAGHLKVSRRLLCLRFHEQLDRTVLETITERRLELLRQKLKSTSRPIAELSLACGFATVNHAKRVFKSATGLSMRDWRAEAKAQSS